MEDNGDFLGAVASNAGDDFHVLWATREMLRLLDAKGDVTAVKVEGLPLDDVHAEVGEHGQAADIVLTRQMPEGTTYRYLQLKHSASNPKENWTWSRLLTRRAKTKPLSSVLGKLAGLLKAVKFKGDFAIVTNQPLSASVAMDIARLIKNGSKPASEDVELFGKLTKAIGLTPRQVITFLKAWDLKGFASTSRLVMESEVIQRLAAMADADARDDANLLQKRVATLMLPESRSDPAVTREVLSVWLGAGSSGMMFPAPSQVEPARPYVRRAAIDHLGAKLAEPQSKLLRLHAGGGCGKTSLICDLPSVLPFGSEIFIYDCYGGGLFLTSDQKRHLPEQAFTQIGNELAARLRTPLVMRRQGSVDVFEAFRKRVTVAAGVLKLRSTNAQLVLCFDAVDNARTGSQHWHEPCFLDVLSQASAWPDNVRIVVSCRTARLQEVGDKRLFEDFEVHSFDVDEVRQLVALHQPEWCSELATTFENLTGGNPRRLVYAIKGLPTDGEMRAVERLMPKAEGINPLFEQRVSEAGKHLGSADKVWQVLDALSRLPRPVPGRILAKLADLAPADINDIAVDVGGIVEREEGWSFHDEDFEAFVIERPESNGRALLERAADMLLDVQLTDRYAATSVAEVLAAANRLDALYALVTRGQKPSSVLTPLEAQFIWSRQLSLAIRCCRTASDITNACSLLIASAEAIQRIKLLEDLTVENLDLSVRFAAEESNRLVMVGQRHRNKRPRLRIELACLAAQTHPETAKTHLRWWRAHLGELRETSRSNGFKVSASDIAAEYRAYAALMNEEAAFARLFEWRPKSALQSVFKVLAAWAAGHSHQTLLDVIDARAWPPLVLAPLMAAALVAGVDMSDPVMCRGVTRLAQATRARWNMPIETELSNSPLLAWQEAMLLICERAIAYDHLKPLVAQILDRAMPKPKLEETKHLYRLRSAGACHARAYALHELISGVTVSVAEWLPPRREEPTRTDRWPARRQEKSPEEYWNESLAETVPAFSRFVEAARITLASLAADPASAWPTLVKVLDVSRNFDQSSHRDPDVATLLMRNHLVHVGIGGGDVACLFPAMREVLKSWSADSIKCSQNLARTLALLPNAHDAALGLLTEIAAEIEADPLPASERVRLFSESARIALPLDVGLAEWLFGKSVEATGAVDFEARSALAAAGAIAKTGLNGSPAERAVFAARLGDAAGAVAESLGIGDDFAWSEVISWITAASLPMGLAAATRWHDWGITPFNQSLPKLITAGSLLSIAQRAALATLASDGPFDLDIVIGDVTALPNWLVKPVLAEQLREGNIDGFLTAFETIECRASNDASAAIDAAKVHCDTFRSWQEADDLNHQGAVEELEVRSDKNDPATLQTQGEIRAALEVGNEKRGPDTYQFCQTAELLGSLALRVPFLEIAFELGRREGSFGEAVPEILQCWSNYPPVTTWMRERFPSYIAGALRKLFHWRYDETEILEAALAATGLDSAAQADVLLNGIELEGERISSDLLYTLTGLIAARIPLENRSGLFETLLLRVEGRTSHPPRICLTDIIPPQDIAESVGRSVFAAMGDMDRRIRWRACHAALVLLRGQDSAWDKLVSCLDCSSEPVFAGAPFYRYAALEQLMMMLLRATVDGVQDVARHTPLILKIIRQESHVIVRELGRSVLLEVDRSGAWQFSVADRTFITNLNRSQFPPVTRRAKFPRRISKERGQQRKYHFDNTDAIPYWYQPAAGLFGMPMDAFLDRLEYWLHDKWGYLESAAHWVQEPRQSRINGSHELMSRRHGTQPIVERLSNHIEWHSMMCVVGELICDQPLVMEPQDENVLESWMERYLPTFSPHWLSDYRSAPPLEPRFWGLGQRLGRHDTEAEGQTWGCSVSPDIFNTEIIATNELVVAANFELRLDNVIQRVYIHSALASPHTANALAQALANTRDHMDFALPDGRFHQDINVPDFQLEAWLQPFDNDPCGDKFDERRGAIAGIPVGILGPANRQQLSFDFERGSWCLPTGEALIKIVHWGSEESENGHGWRATASKDFITDLLKQTGRSLILLVQISRHIHSDDLDPNKPRWLLYVFDAEGILTRVERERRSLGRALVKREGLVNSVDTLGRWMLHRAAELDLQRDTTDEREHAALDLEMEKICIAFKLRDHDEFER
ncbi:hypothetical protein [Pseudomonas sp.]|uniref:hypothetical protein n=1 Tax=Pseudomonas sp. TaxID=306 RepID=UPI003263D7E1